ncbi:U-scoloptoxin(05)-Sm1a-like [Amphibalanus amphitrite]|uniref:U-scoloptoxin(05)-Sm1a-like n=1 Tax=Amphibalanus amphitrite TaxID=1232801 RepID=UPI001C91F696|nr:U-scoloptoxin(05)-Sm1a-like [Amphibalanus amphitrite]
MAERTGDRNAIYVLSVVLLMLKFAPGCTAIECYVCDSSSQIGCAEFLTDTSLLEPESCDNVYDAKYCVKMTQVFEGQLGTKRFCSSRDFGNYCEWVNRPGDPNTYQACVLTCSTNACNTAPGSRAATLLVAMATALGLVGWLRAAR